MNTTEVEEQTTIEVISALFEHVDTISLPIFLIIFVILEIYKLVKTNIHFNKKFELKEESVKSSNVVSNNILQEVVSNHNSTEILKSKIEQMSMNNANNKASTNVIAGIALPETTSRAIVPNTNVNQSAPNMTATVPLIIDIGNQSSKVWGFLQNQRHLCLKTFSKSEMSVVHPYDVEEIYSIQNMIVEINDEINKEHIPRLNDLIHIINVCQTWSHNENLKALVGMRDELIENIKIDIKTKLANVINQLD